MEAKEVMIGDWVKYGNRFALIQSITPNECCILVSCGGSDEFVWETYDNIEPIPLTSEILEKNGFEDWDGWSIYSPENTGIEIAWLGTILKIGGEYGNFELPAIEYIHQLQHALRLCGIDKTIEL